MIQRVQTLWLIVVIICGVLSLKLSFYSGIYENNQYYMLTAANNTPVLITTLVAVMLAVVSIFLYKERKKQLLFCVIGTLISVLSLVLYFLQIKNFIRGTFDISCLFSIAMPVFYIMAITGVYKDAKLIKKMNQLR